MRHPKRLSVLLFASVVGCGGSSPATPPDAVVPVPDARVTTPGLTGVAIDPAPAISLGESQPLTVAGTFEGGTRAAVTTGLTWESSAPAVATVNEAGVVTAVAAGAVKITVTTGGLRAELDLAVVLRVFGDDYGAGLGYAPFGGSTNEPAVDASEKHAGTAALRVEVPATGYTGGAFTTAEIHPLTGFTAISFWARASKPATLNVVGFGNDAATVLVACEWNAVPLTTTWTRYTVPIPRADTLAGTHGLFHIAEGSDEGAYTLWLDDVQYETPAAGAIGPASPAIATETVTRAVGETAPINGAAVTYAVGGANQTIATARRYFTFRSSDEAIATVDADGVVTARANGTATITAKLGTIDAIGVLTVQVGP